jgi:hypothetical protein
MNTHPLLLKTTGVLAALALVASMMGFALIASVQQAHAATLAEQILCYVDEQLGPNIPFDPGTDYCDTGVPQDPGPMPQCFDGIDNDQDGKVDLADPGCLSAVDNDETDPTGSPATTTSTVTILKYVGGTQAMAGNTGNGSFDFASSWNDQGGAGTGNGTFSLGSGNSYQITSSALNQGSSYAVHEVTSDMASSSNTLPAGAECQAGMWRLAGYRTGSSLANAQAATLSTASPSLSGINSNQYVIAVNENCDDNGGGNGNAPTLTIVKHAVGGNGTFNFAINGVNTPALTTTNGWATSTAMTLGTGSSTIAEATSSGWNTTGISCIAGGQAIGTPGGTGSYSISAANGDHVTCMFTNTASSTGTTTDAALHVDSIDAQKTTAVANGTYEDGWRYVFRITTPNNEENLSMRFSDWFTPSSSSTIPVANNMRISSAQASSTGPITLTAANAYSTPPLIMTSDLDPSMPGRQVDVLVEVKIPSGTSNETYTTTYGVQTLP